MDSPLQTATVETASSAHAPQQNVIDPNVMMVVLTWVTFFLLLWLLSKYAWKPILSALEQREHAIRKSVDEADRIKAELQKIDQVRASILAEAEFKAKEVIEQSRKAAIEAAKVIQAKSKEESHILLENAKREIMAEQEKAQAVLRAESARLAVAIASKLIQENLTDDKNQKLVDRMLKEI